MPDESLWLPDGVERDTGRPMGVDPVVAQALHRGSLMGPADDSEEKSEMALSRRLASAARVNGHGRGGLTMATARPRDPMFYWEQNNLPYKWDTPEGLTLIRRYARMLYMTHPIVASAIDIYSTWPMQNMELRCKDQAITDFYTDLFMDTLDWEEFAVDLGREYWTVGEGIALGSFNEALGVWEDDELIDPDDVDVVTSPFHKEPRFEMRLPETIRKVLESGEPKWEYDALMRSYPELKNFMGQDARMPVSSILMRRMKFKAHNFSVRGLPILMRAFRTLLQEEMLNAAFDAVADRLYTPLILVKLGASATDLGTTRPWVPTAGDIAEFEASLDAALAADFRVLTSHFATDISTVFGREMLPRAEQDFERIDGRILQVFGISKTMLSGAAKGETYAADALNFELVSQLLSRYQKLQQRHFRERALVVAEAQGHYDYEVRGGKRYPIMEEVVEYAEDGSQRIVERPKLLVPDMNIRVMNMQAERDQRQLIEALRASGVPISVKTRLTNVAIDLDEERDLMIQEAVKDAVAAQEARKESYLALKARRLPIPEDLERDFGPKAKSADQTGADAEAITTPEEQEPLPSIGVEPITDTTPLAPVPDLSNGSGVPGSGVSRLPQNQWMKARPSQSDERRADMPKAATLHREGEVLEPISRAYLDPAALEVDASTGEARISEKAGPLQFGPVHVGHRLDLDPTRPLAEQVKEAGWGDDHLAAREEPEDPAPADEEEVSA